VHQEAGIERHLAVRRGDDDGVGMAAETARLFEQMHPVAAAQEIRRRETGDARPDDGNGRHVRL